MKPAVLHHAWMAGLLVSLTGCVVVPANERHHGGPPRSAAPPVYAPAPAVVVIPAPPPLRYETRPQPPAAHWFWVEGHWRWDGRQHQWERGHWAEPRRGEQHVPARWVNERGIWVFQPARWQRVEAAPPPPVVQGRPGDPIYAVRPPPPLRQEIQSNRPGNDHFWVAGHWRWERGDHVWVPGHWERERRAERWVPAHWQQDGGGRWVYREGHWARH